MSSTAETMRAFVYDLRAPGHMSFKPAARKPTAKDLKAGEILVSVRAASLNPVDYKKPALIPCASLILGGSPVGQDYSGVVLASRSPSWVVGDEIFGTVDVGCCAEVLVAPGATAARKPASLTHAEAASLVTVGLTALQALEGGGVVAGSRVIVVGASGGCGSAGVQLARSIVGPQGCVVGVCSAASAELVRGLGCCDAIVDYSVPDAMLAALKDMVRSGGAFDAVYDTVTSPDSGDSLQGRSYEAALKPLLRLGGMHCAINGSVRQWIGALVGWQRQGFRLFMQQPNGPQLARIAALCEAGALKAVVDSVHDLTADGAAAAYARLRSRRARGKVCIAVV